MTIGVAYGLMQDDWYRRGNEDLRLDAVTWLAKPTSKIPALILRSAQDGGISNRHAVGIARVIDDTAGARMAHSKSFMSLPIDALDIWDKSCSLFQKSLHNPDSSGAAHGKLMDGQYRGEKYKPGLISRFNGDKFLAFTAYYLAFGGMRAVRDVQRCLGWSADKIKEIVLIVIHESHQLLKKISKRGITLLNKIASAGMGFFPMLFAVLQGRAQIKAMAMGSAKKAPKAIAAVDNEDDDGGEVEVTNIHHDPDDGRNQAHNPDDPDDAEGHGDADVTDHAPADGPPIRTPDAEFDDPDPEDHPEDHEADADPGAKLKMGRELAYEMLRQARKNASGNQRYHDLMDAVDERILLNALQKELRPTDLAVAERMANFLSFCWQWSERTGIFMETSQHRKRLDMSEASVIKQIIHAAQIGYWETGDNKLKDNAKIWIDVTHEDRNGRRRVAVLTRPLSPDLKTKPHTVNGVLDGRKIITNPDHAALREHFFQHVERNMWPQEENTQYFIVLSSDGAHETITAKRLVRPHGTALTSAKSLDDLEDTGQSIGEDKDDTPVCEDLPHDDKAAVALVAAATSAAPDLVRRSMAGDERALGMLAHACRMLPDDRKVMIEATFSTKRDDEAKVDDTTEAHPSCLNQTDRQDLARLLRLDLRTMEKAFEDDTDSAMALKRAIRAMPDKDRSQAVHLLKRAARRCASDLVA